MSATASVHDVSLTINGAQVSVRVRANQTLLDLLREQLGYTGTKRGCETGECGACTVLMNGRPVNACLVLAVKADGKRIETIEGMARGAELHPLQKAFINEGAVQCGFCAPGMLMSARALLSRDPDPSELTIRKAISGNICRCTGYAKIVKAIRQAASEMHGEVR